MAATTDYATREYVDQQLTILREQDETLEQLIYANQQSYDILEDKLQRALKDDEGLLSDIYKECRRFKLL